MVSFICVLSLFVVEHLSWETLLYYSGWNCGCVILDGFVVFMLSWFMFMFMFVLFIRAVSKGRREEMREDDSDVAEVLCVCIDDANFVAGYSDIAVE